MNKKDEKDEKPDWLKTKGYLHFSQQVNTRENWKKVYGIVTNKEYIKSHAFYPLLHVNIKNRRYKRSPKGDHKGHNYVDKHGVKRKNTKVRPIHYANHLDTLIFAYYASELQKRYNEVLETEKGLDDLITAYRKIEIIPGEKKGKSTIHFAHEVFQEINRRVQEKGNAVAIAFDIKSFFSSMDHNILKQKWCALLNYGKVENDICRLPSDHYNVFRATTNFSFIYKDDLRTHKVKNGRRAGFDEKKLAQIRNKMGFQAFFESDKEFRKQIKNKNLRIYPNPFKNKEKVSIGIPQGLPISATLANLYLIDFDRKALSYLINDLGCFYRRYSDDIVVIGDHLQIEQICSFVTNEMKTNKVKINESKTEKHLFKKSLSNVHEVSVYKIEENGNLKNNVPFTYLGFEHYGNKTLIKSANLSKFYRRMIYSTKGKIKRAEKVQEKTLSERRIIFRRQLDKLYSNIDLDKPHRKKQKWKTFYQIDTGEFRIKVKSKDTAFKTNYFSYVERASKIMNEPAIKNQLRKHKKILSDAIERHSKKKN
ncbi:MAG: reverse transcriptase domain-containing protein [Crocinitomicaceae bacterium]